MTDAKNMRTKWRMFAVVWPSTQLFRSGRLAECWILLNWVSKICLTSIGDTRHTIGREEWASRGSWKVGVSLAVLIQLCGVDGGDLGKPTLLGRAQVRHGHLRRLCLFPSTHSPPNSPHPLHYALLAPSLPFLTTRFMSSSTPMLNTICCVAECPPGDLQVIPTDWTPVLRQGGHEAVD